MAEQVARMRARWLLAIAGSAFTVGAGVLLYVYPSETAQMIQSVLGVSSYRAAETIAVLTVLGVTLPTAAFVLINVRDYWFRRHPPRREPRAGGHEFLEGLALGNIFLWGSLSALLIYAYKDITLTGVAFVSVMVYTIICSCSFVIGLRRDLDVRQMRWLVLSLPAPYYFIVLASLLIYLWK